MEKSSIKLSLESQLSYFGSFMCDQLKFEVYRQTNHRIFNKMFDKYGDLMDPEIDEVDNQVFEQMAILVYLTY